MSQSEKETARINAASITLGGPAMLLLQSLAGDAEHRHVETGDDAGHWDELDRHGLVRRDGASWQLTDRGRAHLKN